MATFYVWAAFLDPYLHPWDERFHAVVAQNLAQDPFTPTLYPDTLVPAPYDRWDRAHIWLHKQPAFLWMMAGSLKIFGNAVWAIRLPSALMAFLFIFALFRAGKLLFSRRTGVFAAIFGLSCYFLFDLVTGHQGTDHNDAVFLGWVSLSVLGWLEWKVANHRWGFWLIGIAAGMAVLTKWLPGLWVFGIWGIAALVDYKMTPILRNGMHWVAALAIAIAIFLPWQFYIHAQFPAEAAAELEYNALHISQALEGHDHPWWYHFANWPNLFGWATLPFMLLGIRRGLLNDPTKAISVGLAIGILGVFAFYSCAATKMPAYPLLAALPIFLFAGIGMEQVAIWMNRIKSKILRVTLISALFIPVLLFNFPYSTLQKDHFESDPKRNIAGHISTHNHAFYRTLSNTYPQPTIYFNLPGRQYIDLMFYSQERAFSWIPSRSLCADLGEQGYSVVIFAKTGSTLADSLSSLPNVTVDRSEILGEY